MSGVSAVPESGMTAGLDTTVESTAASDSPTIAHAAPQYRSDRLPDRFMRRMLGVQTKDRRSAQGAQRAFRTSVIVSGIRCLISYLLIPILVPILSISGWVAAPIGLALCAIALVNGIVSMRRFWRSDHKYRWMYTGFMAVVFLILALGLVSDLGRLGVW